MKKINWEKVTNFIKKKNFIIAISVFALTMLSIGVSYASFFSVKTNTTNQSITTGTLAVSFGDDSSSIVVNGNMQPMSNETGMAQEEASLIYIQNTGTIDSTFTLNVGYDMENFNNANTGTSGVLTSLDYIMLAVYEYNGTTEADRLIAGPISIADLPIYRYDATDYRNNRYSLIFDTVGSVSSGNATKAYRIKSWLSADADVGESFTQFFVNAEVVAEAENAKMKYNLNGTITGGENATISLHNNSIVTTADSLGAFTINGLYPGVYNIDITKDNTVYSGNLIIEEGSNVAVSSMGSSFSGNNIYNVVNDYGTTINKVLKVNNLEYPSKNFNLESGNLPASYRIVGGYEENISGLQVSLNSANKSISINL